METTAALDTLGDEQRPLVYDLKSFWLSLVLDGIILRAWVNT